MTVGLFEYWDVGEDLDGKRIPNLGKTSTARVMQALVKLHGKMTSSCVFGDDTMEDRWRDLVYRIALPVGKKEAFEEMTGYRLSRPPQIQVN